MPTTLDPSYYKSSIPTGSNDLPQTESLTIELGMSLEQLLSIAGISLPPIPPTGSFTTSSFKELLPPLPKNIRFTDVKGIVVNVNTNEPIKGVKVSNAFLKNTTTNSKGEFTLSHPDLANTYLPANKFPIKFNKNLSNPRYTKTQFIPYSSTNDIKSNAGIITMSPFESNLKKETIEFLRFPEVTVDKVTTQDVTFEFHIQKELFKGIKELKSLVIPIIIGMISSYGISKVKELIEKAKLDKKSAFDEIKDIISCPPQNEMDKIIKNKNKLSKILSSTQKKIEKTLKILKRATLSINAADLAYKAIIASPIPIAPGILTNVVLNIQDLKLDIKKIISKTKLVSNVTLSILLLLENVLSLIINMLNLLDLLIEFCYPKNSTPSPIPQDISQIADQLTLLTTQQSNQLSPIITNINGFKMGVETEPTISTSKSLKRRRATATNKQGIIMLTGEWSFSSIDQILIDELVFYIQTNDLRAD
jgi:hypothetical protein